MKRFARGGLAVFAVAIVALVAIRLVSGSGSAAPKPPIFEGAPATLEEASVKAQAEDRYVLAYATADWCGPCQHFKATTLVNSDVEGWIREHTVPVYIDTDKNPSDAGSLNVTSIPATYLLKDGEVVRSIIGAVPADDFLAALRESAAQKS